MAHAVTGIDHCIILVENLDAARERMQALGFQCAPRGVHSEHMGTHNHCVMLERGYFEVLAILHPTERNEQWRARLSEREGLSGIALQSADARAAHSAFTAAGIHGPSPVDFARPVELDSGTTEARFTVTSLPEEATPGTSMFVCQQHTPEVVWLPEYLAQPNGVTGLVGLTVAAAQPAQWQAAYARVFGADRVHVSDANLHINTSHGNVDMLTPAALAQRYPDVALDTSASLPYIAALSLSCASLQQTRDYLAGRGVRLGTSDRGGACVSPADACGVVFEFLSQP